MGGSSSKKKIEVSTKTPCSADTCYISLNNKTCQSYCAQHCTEWIENFFTQMPTELIPVKGWNSQPTKTGLILGWRVEFVKEHPPEKLIVMVERSDKKKSDKSPWEIGSVFIPTPFSYVGSTHLCELLSTPGRLAVHPVAYLLLDRTKTDINAIRFKFPDSNILLKAYLPLPERTQLPAHDGRKETFGQHLPHSADKASGGLTISLVPFPTFYVFT